MFFDGLLMIVAPSLSNKKKGADAFRSQLPLFHNVMLLLSSRPVPLQVAGMRRPHVGHQASLPHLEFLKHTIRLLSINLAFFNSKILVFHFRQNHITINIRITPATKPSSIAWPSHSINPTSRARPKRTLQQ